MARIDNLTNFLTDVATAIRNKKEITEQIPAANFDTEILSIETGIDTSTDNPITASDVVAGKEGYVNGEKVVGALPDFSNGGIMTGNSVVTLADPWFKLEGHIIDGDMKIGNNTNISAEAGYSDVANAIELTPEKLVKGNTILGVEGTAEAGGTTINNQDKTITSNGQYTADEGYTGLGTVTVQVPQEGGKGDVKLFSTVEEMQADSTAKEGDLAVIYREEIQNMTVDTQTQYIAFPETVVLPEVFTGNDFCMLRAVDETVMFNGEARLSGTMFNFNGYTDGNRINVRYTSNDGITYNRDTFSGNNSDLTNVVDLGTVVKVYRPEEWNDSFGYFMQIEGMTFDGLYDYEYSPNNDYISFVTNISKSEPYYEYSEPINVKAIMDKFMKKLIPLNTGNYNGILIYDNTNSSIIFYKSLNQLFGTLTSDDTDILSINGGTYSSPQTTSKVWNKYVYDINADNITQSTVTSPSTTAYTAPGNSYNDNMYLIDEEIDPSKLFAEVYVYTDDNNYEVTTRYIAYKVYDYVNNLNSGQINLKAKVGELLTWIYAKTQFNLTSPEQLLPNISAYGKNGNVTGDGSIETPDNTFADIAAQLYYNIQQKYNNMEPRVLTDADKEIDDNICVIPTKSDGTVLLDTSQVTNMQSMFSNCSNLTEIPTLNTSQATDMNSMFSGCSNLTKVPLLDTADVTNMRSMFSGCSKLIDVPELDTSNVTAMAYMFSGCSNLTEIPIFNMDNVANTNSMFERCESLVVVPELNLSNVTSVYDMFTGCINLTTVPVFDISKINTILRMFSNCPNLSNDSLNNILASCITANSITNTDDKTLKYAGLSETQATTCTTLSNWAACEAAGWTTGY